MSILAPIGFYVCMGLFVLYGLWTDEREEKKRLLRKYRRYFQEETATETETEVGM